MSRQTRATPAIRPFRANDVPAAATIVVETPLWGERYGVDRKRAEDMLATAVERGDGLFAAEVNGGLAGFAWYLARGAFAKSGYLRLIGVAAGLRGGGVGAALLAEVEYAVGGDLVILVSDFNHAAQRFYARHGYAEVGRLPGYVLPDVAEIILWKRR
jgi:ribosomal protein S18 acetylase RimI-like enzyme